MRLGSTTLVILTAIITIQAEQTTYEASWDSLDSRPLPGWFDEAKFGIFLHWGVYAVPGFGSEWFWNSWKSQSENYVLFMTHNYAPGFTYQDFAPQFTAEFFDPKEWAFLFQKSGAKYVVLTSKHHEGYTLWPSKYSFSWNSQDVGPHNDLVGALAGAIRANTDLRFGVYHSLYEWYNPLYESDKASSFVKSEFVSHKAFPEMVELVEKYKPDVLWSDGDWEAPDTYWRSQEFLAWLYNESPVRETVLTNDRWGMGTSCKHGGFYSCMDRYNPGVVQPHKWENAMTIDKSSWGYRRNAKLEDFLTTHELLETMVTTVSCGGNILMNVGPTKEGLIAPIFQQRLMDIGAWLSINGEAIYGTKPWTYQNDTNGYTWYTAKNDAVYAINLHWPEENVLSLWLVSELFENPQTKVTLLGTTGDLTWTVEDQLTHIDFPDKATVKGDLVWVVKIEPQGAKEEIL